jgi:trk system potassium uptake protein TrkH
MPKPDRPLSSALLLAYGFAGLILLGTILLILPVSAQSGQITSPINALFSATSAVCVTGLVVVDGGTYWSTFGQAVLLVLFQIGGLGFITGATLLILAIGGKFGLKEKLIISESIGVNQLGGVIGLVTQIALFSFLVEAIGTLIFYFRLTAIADQSASLWVSVFHAASAFNNCGMSLFGNFSSLTRFQTDPIILLTTAFLIILGGIGYLVVVDLIRQRRFVRLSLDTKVVLVFTGVLLVLGTLFYLGSEFSNPSTLGQLQFPQKLLVAFFQSVTPRTAGFSAIDIGSLRQISLFFTMFLMCVGGAAGSAAGGIKVNTFGVLTMTILSTLRGDENIGAFGRHLTKETIYRAMVLFTLYIGVVTLVTVLLSATEGFPVDKILFEAFSAMGTVGLSTGITPNLSVAGKIIIAATMFVGRLGPLTLMAVLARRPQGVNLEYPHESIRLG